MMLRQGASEARMRSRAEGGGQRTVLMRGCAVRRWTEDGGQKTVARRRRTEDGGRKTED